MPDVCLYAQVHQPYRVRKYGLFDIGASTDYFDEGLDRMVLRRVAERCYIPANRLLAELIERSEGRFRLALSLSGTVLEQLAAWAPEALESFQALVATGGVELLGETYAHSLSGLADRDEFAAQVRQHGRAIARWFGRRPRVFRNTELIYADALAPEIAALGFHGVMVEGAEHVLRGRSPNHVYSAADEPRLRLLPRNFQLSDDVGFRFSLQSWDAWPVTADRYAEWLAASPGESVHLYLDYETFGEHQWRETGIFDFLRHLPEECLKRGLRFVQPTDLAARTPRGPLSFPEPTSWADLERDTSAWLGNRMQRAAHERLYELRPAVLASGDPHLLAAWRRLSTSDHVYYMSTKWFGDGDVHQYFSPFESPYDAFVAYMNVLQDLADRLEGQPAGRPAEEEWTRLAGMAVVA